jgi:glutathione peroxidase
MTIKQKILKAAYPLLRSMSKAAGPHSKILINVRGKSPLVSFYGLSATAIQGNAIDMKQFQGKKVLLVNTASDCGYTAQYAELESLYNQFKERLIILGFPANDFKNQESGNNNDIAQFCQVNYGVTFPITQKTTVVKGNDQHPVFRWLTSPEMNGWNIHQPDWNFSKYLVDEQGILTHFFGPAVSPGGKEISEALS